jgi:predicted DCC family thiol-disulfide oxidoreductase YuxK
MEKIIIFDGVCNFCNSSVNFIMRNDKHNLFRFTANQNEAGKAILAAQGVSITDIETVFLYDDGKLYKKSDAAVMIAKYLRFPWNMGYLGILLPRFIRDVMYDFVAKNRYKWFGKKESCRVPTPSERAKFLS